MLLPQDTIGYHYQRSLMKLLRVKTNNITKWLLFHTHIIQQIETFTISCWWLLSTGGSTARITTRWGYRQTRWLLKMRTAPPSDGPDASQAAQMTPRVQTEQDEYPSEWNKGIKIKTETRMRLGFMVVIQGI